MDCNMPVMDGFQATQEIRKITSDSNRIHIVTLTAYATDNFRDKSIASGMDAFITKPLKNEEIKQILIQH